MITFPDILAFFMLVAIGAAALLFIVILIAAIAGHIADLLGL